MESRSSTDIIVDWRLQSGYRGRWRSFTIFARDPKERVENNLALDEIIRAWKGRIANARPRRCATLSQTQRAKGSRYAKANLPMGKGQRYYFLALTENTFLHVSAQVATARQILTLAWSYYHSTVWNCDRFAAIRRALREHELRVH